MKYSYYLCFFALRVYCFIEYIEDMLNSEKPSFLFYGHRNLEEWLDVLACNSQDGGVNAKTEMENLKDYLEQYKSLSGLVLQKLTIEVITITFYIRTE